MDNQSAFNACQYDKNIRKVIPFYDEIHQQILGIIQVHCQNRPISVLDTGCGTGTSGLKACQTLRLSELVLCDPSEKMIADTKKKLGDYSCEVICTGSENLSFANRFDVVTAIQSHHYFDKATREKAVINCFNALKPEGIFIYFENTAPFSERGKNILFSHWKNFQIQMGRTSEEVKSHLARYNNEFFPITVQEHLEMLHRTGFQVAELFWHSYMQSGFYAVKF